MNPFEKLDAAIEETTAPTNPLDAAIQEVSAEEKDNRRRALLGAAERSPEEIVEARRVGKVLNLPAGAVVHDLPGLKKRARLEEIDAAIEGAPVLARKLGEPEFAGLAQDDAETSKRVEQAANFKPTINGADVSMLIDEALKRNPALDWDTARSNVLNKYNVDNLATGMLRTPQRPTLTPESFVHGLLLGAKNLVPKMREQARMQFAGNLGLQEMEADAQRRYEQLVSRESLAAPEFERGDTLARYAYGGAQSVLTNVPGLALAVLSRNPYVALVPAVTQTELDQYARTRSRGGSVGEANLAGALSGAVEGATELYPMKFLVDSIGKRTLMQLVVGDQIREQFGEQIATHMQDAIDTAIANPTKTWGEYWKERPDSAAQTIVAVLMQSAVVATTGYAANSTAGKNDAAIKADQYAQSFLKLTQLAEASKVRSRDPESFQQYLAEVAEEGPVQEVWVSPNTLMQSGVDVQALAQLSPSFAEQLDDALQRNGEVRIPVAEFATALPGTGFEQVILPHLRTDPDAMTQAEAQVFMQSQAEEFQREAETVLAKVEERSAFDTSAQVVEDSILSQLKTANRFTEDVNREYAKVARAIFSSAAARMKVTPEEAYKKFALQIRAQQIAAQYDQQTGQLKTETPEFKAWFGDSKVVDADGKPLVVYRGDRGGKTAFSGRVFFTNRREIGERYAKGGHLNSVMLALKNPLVVDAKGDSWMALPAPEAIKEEWGDPDKTIQIDYLAEWAEGEGYDGLIVRDVLDQWGDGDQYVVFRPEQIKSVFNRGTFDPNDPNILHQSSADFGMTEEEQGVSLIDWLYGSRPPFTTAKRVRELGELLVEMSPKAHAEYTDENKAFIAGVMVKEVDAAFKSGKTAVDWYEHNIQQMHDIVALEYPEVATDPEARFAFDYILSVLSNGQKVPANFKNAMRYYERYRTEKRMPSIDSTYGVRHEQMAQAFQLYNIAKNEVGAEVFREFMLSKHPVVTLNGMRTSPVRELVDQEVYGGTIIGSKIGGAFLQNISGNHDALTMDVWWMRSWGRLSGTLLASRYDPSDKNDSGLKDATNSGAHKAFMRETALEALSQLQKMGYPDLQMDGLQATYWYMEKELYAINGNADADVEGTDYGTEAARHAAKNGYAEHPLVAELLRDSQRPLGRGGRGADGRAREGGRADQVLNQEGLTHPATTEAQALVDQRTPELIEEYFARFGNIIDPDNVKQLFPAYVADPSLAAAVHEPSSQLARTIYTAALARNRGAPVVFTAGGGGSGKTEAMSLAQDLLGGVGEGGLIYDSTLSSFESAVRRIDEALASGSEVDIVYTNREVGDAFLFAMTRARVVPLSTLAQAHVGASNTIRQVADHYAGNPRVAIHVVNNLGEIDDINLGSLADVPTYEYNEVERRLHELARGAVEAGRISQERYAALTSPAERADGAGAAEVQGGEQGQDLGGAAEGLASFFQSSSRQPVVSSTPIADIEEFNTNMPAFLRRPGWAIITGIQEKLGAFDTPANIAANAKLEAELAARGLPFKKGPGKYLNVDQGESFLVKMSEAEALDLAKRYGQQSVLTNEGYVYQNGSLTPVDHTKDTFGDEARKQDGYTEIDGKAFSLGLDFSQEIAKEDRVNPALPFAVHGIKAVHYSKAERSTLDGHRFGEGLTGAERERLRDADPRLRVRTAFYVSNGRGVFPEAGVGSVAHLSTLNNIYDADADALHIWSKHRDANARELAVIEAGYAGYLGRDTFDRQGTAVVFGRSDLPTKKVDNPGDVAEVPPPPNISEVQRVRRAVATSARYPAGQMPRSAWGEYVKQIEPSHFETLAPFGIFEGEEVVYRDELLRTVFDQSPIRTETPEFKAWFGDSKVVDAQGKPLVVYHSGTFDENENPIPDVGTGGFHFGTKIAAEMRDIGKRVDDAITGIAVEQAENEEGVLRWYWSADGMDSYDVVGEEGFGSKAEAQTSAERFVVDMDFSGTDPTPITQAYLSIRNPLRMPDQKDSWVAAVAKAKRLGHDGIVYRNEFEDKGEDSYIVFSPTQIKSVFNRGTFDPNDPNILAQGDQAPRGQISFGTDITQQPSIISLLQQANLTTFIHELGHFQLEVLASMAAQGDASAQADMQILLNWFGVPDLATWQGLLLEEKRPYHEQLARGFEAYTLEGKAPSIELQGTFARIRAWMLDFYKELSLRVQLTDEVRGVFDRMLATEQQIAESETQRGYAALFESAAAAGMTAEGWVAYQNLGAQVTENATAELQARSVRNMRWASNAKSHALKALQKDAVAKHKAVEAEVREEVRRQPVYAARRFLAYGELGPEVLFSKGEELTGKLDLGALKAMYGEGPAAPWRYLPTGENGLAASEGLHPDTVAEMFGFTSGDHLVRELVGAEQEASVIEGLTDQRMLERYGDLTTPEAIERAAEKAIHNEARVRFIATELNALARATGQRRVLVPAAREFADRTVARQLIRLLKPTQYAAAEARAAKAAMAALKAGNTNEAAVEKRNQLLNNLTAKAANEAAADIEGGVTYLKKFDREGTRKKVDIDYLDQIDAILERFDLRTGQSLKAIDKRKSLADWIAKQEEMGLEPAIPDSLRNEAFRKHYKELTVEEFRGLLDSIRNIEHLGRLKTKLLTAVRQREFAAAVEEIVTSIEANAKGTVAERRTSDRGRLVDVSQLARNFLADHRKFASLAREMDGWQDGGVMWEYLVRGMNAAGDKEASMREAATVKLSELLKPILKAGGMGKKTYFPQIGKSFTREERIGIALNMGNEVNRERVMSGEKLGPVQLQAILDTLTPEEGDFVQAVWTFFESYRPQIAEKQRRLTGTEPEWVQPTQVFLGGKYREGGYYPIAYDPLRSSRAEADTAAEVQRQIERGLYVQAQTRRGHLKARTESTGRPLRYDLGVIVKHVDQVVHDLSWHEFLIDANRLLRSGRIDGAIREHYGPEKLATMKDALRDIAIGDMAAQGSLDHILNHLRHGATIVGLGWRVTTSLLQPLGLTQSMVRIGPQWVAKGARHWMGDTVSLENSARLIGEKSTFMRLRSKTLQREINEIRNKVKGKDSVMEASYFYLIQKLQLVADIPTWWGAYEKAMSTEADEARAIALADQAVIDAQGSGQIKDLSAVQRGGAGWKLFTTFYSFFNTTYQNTVEAVGRTNFRSPASVGLLGVDLLLLYTIPAILGTLMKVGLSGDWEDEDALLRKLLADQVSYLTGTMMLVREGGGIAQNLIDPQHAFDYTGPASLRFFASVSKLAKQVGQGEADEPFWKSLNEVAGVIFHYPAGQINATIDGINSMAEGKTQNPGALIVGHRDR